MANRFTYISTNTTTAVSASPAVLKRITLNEPTAGTVTVYNNTAGSGAVVALIAAATPAQTLDYDVECSIGITIVTSGADDMTVVHA